MQTSCNFVLVQHRHLVSDFEETTVSPRGRRDDMPPADGSSIQKSWQIYVRPRTGPLSTHLWWPTVAKLQAASVHHGTDRQTDRHTIPKCPLRRGHNKAVIDRRLRPIIATLEITLSTRKVVPCVRWPETSITAHSL